MSGPADLQLAKQFMNEMMNSTDSVSDAVWAGNALYLVNAIMTGGWVAIWDERKPPSVENSEGWPDSNGLYEWIEGLDCRHLLQPYLEHKRYSANEMIALDVAHKITTGGKHLDTDS